MVKKLAVLGAGSWGLTLAWLACGNKTVCLWDRSADKLAGFTQNRQITFPVPVRLQPEIQLTPALAEAVDGADAVILAVTSAGTRAICQALGQTPEFSSKTVVINASKGIEYPSLQTMSAVISQELPQNPLAVLSGPTLAPEILQGLPTASCIASHNTDLLEWLQHELFEQHILRLYSNTDLMGVELGGSLKNVFAIASGYMKAKKLGDNAYAALMTRGLAEMTRFSVALGADAQTLYGLSGLGDLLATCNSPFSRNYQVGYRLAQGQALQTILSDLKVVAEGVQTAYAVSEWADKIGLDVPIVRQVTQAFSGNYSEEMMIRSLMSRKLKSEKIKP